MRVPVVRGVIERRLLVNYRVDPDALAAALPAPFRPKLVGGAGVAGICLIRLAAVRPRWAPALAGVRSENAAHRVAVEWDEGGRRREGVYIPRRDTSSRLNHLAGGRLFPGVHHRAAFTVHEADGRLAIALESADGVTRVAVEARPVGGPPPGSVFGSLDAASAFFAAGAIGYSATRRPGEYDGLELRTRRWAVEALAVDTVASSYFEDGARFPRGAVAFDSAFLMRDVPHEWHGLATLRARDAGAPAAAVTR